MPDYLKIALWLVQCFLIGYLYTSIRINKLEYFEV
jgi:hypothetical protein